MDKLVFTRKIGKKGLTPGVSFPPELLSYSDLHLGDHVTLHPHDDKSILIKKVKNV